MKELGIIIYSDGETTKFGKAIYADEVGYYDNPGHSDSFALEVLTSFKFKLSGLKYMGAEGFYGSLTEFAKQGLMTIINNKQASKDEDKILAYMPSDPTEEQVEALKKLELTTIPNQRVLEFSEEDDIYTEYDSIDSYIEIKSDYRHK